MGIPIDITIGLGISINLTIWLGIPILKFLKQERYFISHGLALNYQLLKGNYDHIN